jgi:pimeloyl-ACP methyl ester carboxylesterase
MHPSFENAPTRIAEAGGVRFAYRELGASTGVPLVLLHHLTAVLDDWDPAVVDGLAANRRVILFDNRGVGGSSGTTPTTIHAMARDALSFIEALGLTSVDLMGFSMGGFISQLIAEGRTHLVRRVILAGTGPAGGEGISRIRTVLAEAIQKAREQRRHPKHILFFSQSREGQIAADAFLKRLEARTRDRDAAVSNESIEAHLVAIDRWSAEPGSQRPLAGLKQPVLIVNGDNDIMVPTSNSIALFAALPNAELSIFPNAGHGGIFQYHREFVEQAHRFLSG